MGIYQDQWHDAFNARKSAKTKEDYDRYTNIMNQAHNNAVNAGVSDYGKGTYNRQTSSYVAPTIPAYTNTPSGNWSYNHGFNSFKEMYNQAPGWKTANVKGITYHNKPDGIYQEVGRFNDGTPHLMYVGNGVNQKTGEFTMPVNKATENAYNNYAWSNGVSSPYGGNVDNHIDPAYVNSMANGTMGQYNKENYNKALSINEIKRKNLARIALEKQAKRNGVTPEVQSTLNNNSFEASISGYDPLGTQSDRVKELNDEYLNRQIWYLKNYR